MIWYGCYVVGAIPIRDSGFRKSTGLNNDSNCGHFTNQSSLFALLSYHFTEISHCGSYVGQFTLTLEFSLSYTYFVTRFLWVKLSCELQVIKANVA
jgi:hypothetical protein